MLLQFEQERLVETIEDPMEREMKSWDARWRPEALSHYLPQGWSFGAFREQKIQGYFLGQPYLFHRGLTQTLWIEHLAFTSIEVGVQLLEVAHKWAKDKHLQAVLLENIPAYAFIAENFPKALVTNRGWIELRSTRF